MERNFKIQKQRSAFTLPEVLVAMSILVVVIFAATSLLVAALRSNKDNINTLIAYGLAQEGLEGVRNMRDSDWLLGAKFTGEVGIQNSLVWNAVFPTDLNVDHFYTIDYNQNQSGLNLGGGSSVVGSGDLSGYAPWVLAEVNTTACANNDYGSCDFTLLKKVTDVSGSSTAGGLTEYVHNAATGTGNSQNTLFHRYLIIKQLNYGSGQAAGASEQIVPATTTTVSPSLKKMQVSSVVEWKEFARNRKVQLDTVLTDWKPLN